MKYEIKKKAIYSFIAKYQPDKNNNKKVKIFDENFIKKNKNTCKIIYANKLLELKEYFEDIDTNYNHKDLIKFKIIFINNIIDMSYTFYGCDALISLSDNNKTNINISNCKIYIINTSCMFDGCKSLTSLPDISNWSISNNMNMSYIYNKYNSLIDISGWNTSNINDISFKFDGCTSIISSQDFYALNKYKNDIIFELTYKNNEDKVKILDQRFINKNRDKIKIIYNKYAYELEGLKEYFEGIDKMHNDDTFKLLLCLDKNIEDISFIFNGCKSLISVEYYQLDKLYGISNEFNSLSLDYKSSQSSLNNNSSLNNSNSFYEGSKIILSEILEL